MNRFEFDKTMEVFGREKAERHEINGCSYYLPETKYYTIVKGNTPYELAMLIRGKYDNNVYQIRVGGLHELCVPSGDVYTYHIDTIEGLTAFLLEREDYYSKKEEASNKMDDVLKEIYSKMLKDINPTISICDWMLDRKNRKAYFKSLLDMKSATDLKLRKKLDLFDSIINPFSNQDVDINKSQFAVRGYGYAEEAKGWFSLIDKESGITMTTIREDNGFVTKLDMPSEKPFGVIVYHYFDDAGEVIAFESYDETGLKRIEYNLTDKSFGEHYGEKHQATGADKKYVLEKLDEYTAVASNIVAKNLSVNSSDKKFVKNQQN